MMNATVDRYLLSESAKSLFGLIAELNAVTGTISIIIIIFFVQVVEHILSSLNKQTKDTPFEGMVII
jgi:hypothetical protein